MSRKEIMGTLRTWATAKTVRGAYIALILGAITRRPEHLDRLAGMGVKTPEELYKICLEGW